MATVIEIVNTIQDLLAINRTTDLEGDHSRVLLHLLNQVVTEVSDKGDWQELYREASIPLIAGRHTYSVTGGRAVKRIVEMAVNGQRSALQLSNYEDMRNWQRSARTGTPRHFSIRGTDTRGNPKIILYPTPSEDGTLDLAFYERPEPYDHSSISEEVPFAETLMVKGLYWKALLEESNYQLTNRTQVAMQDYATELQEVLNRFNSDTGHSVRFVPAERYGYWR